MEPVRTFHSNILHMLAVARLKIDRLDSTDLCVLGYVRDVCLIII
jgi:hypothetical protein